MKVFNKISSKVSSLKKP